MDFQGILQTVSIVCCRSQLSSTQGSSVDAHWSLTWVVMLQLLLTSPAPITQHSLSLLHHSACHMAFNHPECGSLLLTSCAPWSSDPLDILFPPALPIPTHTRWFPDSLQVLAWALLVWNGFSRFFFSVYIFLACTFLHMLVCTFQIYYLYLLPLLHLTFIKCYYW